MREYLNADTLFAELQMYRDSDQLFLVVEGPYDARALQEHVSDDVTLVYRPGGKQTILKAAKLSHSRNLENVRFLVDRDYDDLKAPDSHAMENVFVSDGHDSFIDLIMAEKDQLIRVIDVFSVSVEGPHSWNRANKISAAHVLNKAIELACSLAAVRIVDARRQTGLNFKTFKFSNSRSTELDPRYVAEVILKKSRSTVENIEEFLDEVVKTYRNVVTASTPPIGDHDLFQALAHVMRQSGVRKQAIDYHQAYILRVACPAVTSTRWYMEIVKWCAKNMRVGFTCEPALVVAPA